MLSVKFSVSLALVCWYETHRVTGDLLLGTVVAIGKDMGTLAIGVVASTYLIIEGSVMLADRYLKKQYKEGKAEVSRSVAEWYWKHIEKLKDVPPPPIDPKDLNGSRDD